MVNLPAVIRVAIAIMIAIYPSTAIVLSPYRWINSLYRMALHPYFLNDFMSPRHCGPPFEGQYLARILFDIPIEDDIMDLECGWYIYHLSMGSMLL